MKLECYAATRPQQGRTRNEDAFLIKTCDRPFAAAEHIRNYPPAHIVQENLDKLVEAIEAPWGPRIVRQIRQAMETVDGVQTSQEIVDAVRRLGLEPFQAPAPLPPIQEEDIRLICWLWRISRWVNEQ